MATKYAVYIIAIEDTEDNDLLLGRLPVITMDRLGGNLSETDALDAVMSAEVINWEIASEDEDDA